MMDFSRQRILLACLASAALMMSSCGDDSVSGTEQTPNCGDQFCGADQECVDGACKDKQDPCDACTENQECVDGACQDKDPCAACSDTQQCVEGQCKDLCGGEVCLDNQKCENQVCVDSEDPCAACSDTETCVNGKCEPLDPCAGKTCSENYRCDSSKNGECVAIDPCESVICNDAQTCLNARCIDNECIVEGAEMACGDGKVCAKGQCVDDGCQEVTCDEGWQCIKGICEETACINFFCEEGRSCKGGACIDNECLDMVCDEGMICSKGTCTYDACLDKDPCTIGKTCNVEGVCVFIEEPAISMDDLEDKTTNEAGKSVALALRLNNQPTMDVRVTCEVLTESPNAEVEVHCDEIVFNADNWQLEQSIVVTGVDDYVKDGDQSYKIKVMTLSEDIDFAELVAESVELTNVDKTTPGVVFSETTLTTYEDQTQEAATFTIALTSIPAADVRISYSVSNANEGSVSPSSVIFTKDNWNVPQTVQVKGVDDSVEDNNKNYTVYFAPTHSDDPDYHEFMPSPIRVTNIDNDVAGLNIQIPAEGYVISEGLNHAILVKLATQPQGDVKVTMASDTVAEAEFETTEVTLNAENWNTGVEVFLRGIADYIIDGDKPVKLTFTASSEDTNYNLEPVVYLATVKDMDTAEVIVTMGDAPNVKEGSSEMLTMSLTLASQPTQKVTVDVSVTDSTELKINKTSLSFSPEHWDLPQDILVNSVDDSIVDGNIKSLVVMQTSSADTHFNAKTKEVEFTTVDDDVAGFTIQSNMASFPENSGASTSMKIALLSQPLADVKVAVSSSDATELSVTSGNTLTFTTSNWNVPQVVSIKVVDDNIADSAQTAYVKFVGTSTDKNFNNISGQSAIYTIVDDDAPTVSLSASQLTIAQASPSTTASVALGVQPTSNVTVTLSSPDSGAITFSPSSLTFTTDNWDKSQNVNVNVNFGAIAQASATATIVAKATAGNSYNNVSSNNIKLNLVKVPEVQTFGYTGAAQTVTLPAGRFKLEVWGAQGGSQMSYVGGKGGYSVGTVTLAESTTLHIYVGGVGQAGTTMQSQAAAGGFNGGGIGYWGSGGGGATHIAVQSGLLSALSGARQNVYIVAGAGGGGGNNGTGGGYGGGTSGGRGQNTGSYSQDEGEGGTQSTGYAFGKGGDGGSYGFAAGGGSGWFGGYGGTSYSGNGIPNGGGGSGYVNTTVLTSAQTIAGNSSVPAPAGGTELGHTGNGYARITLVK